MSATELLKKYGAIIAEEVNVKEVTVLDESVTVTITYIPLGQKLWGVFGKDTSVIIGAAKDGNASRQSDGKLRVRTETQEWLLEKDMYEVRYSGIDEFHQTIESWVIVSLDMTITEELKKEGVARELSRFLNQMRKDAQFQIDEKIHCLYSTNHEYMQQVVDVFTDMFCEEALLASLQTWERNAWWHIATFESEEGKITFALFR